MGIIPINPVELSTDAALLQQRKMMGHEYEHCIAQRNKQWSILRGLLTPSLAQGESPGISEIFPIFSESISGREDAVRDAVILWRRQAALAQFMTGGFDRMFNEYKAGTIDNNRDAIIKDLEGEYVQTMERAYGSRGVPAGQAMREMGLYGPQSGPSKTAIYALAELNARRIHPHFSKSYCR